MKSYKSSSCQICITFLLQLIFPASPQINLPTDQPVEKCVWGNWGSWQRCTKPCGYGSQSRTRSRPPNIVNGENIRCKGKTEEKRACNKQNCDGSVPLSDGFIVMVNRCTASIIADNWLLTAAHCFENEMHRSRSGSIRTESRFGDTVLDLSNSRRRPIKVFKRKSLPKGTQWTRPMEQPLKESGMLVRQRYWRKVDKIIIHSKFINEARSWQGFDYALVKLSPEHGERGLPDGNVMPVCLPSPDFDARNNNSLFMAGYGRRSIPHCLTDTSGPEKYEACGREITCSGDAKTRSCYLEFLDHQGKEQNKCVTSQPTPSVYNDECKTLHKFKPSLQNKTVHLFSEFDYITTCYPLYLQSNNKGWCSTRRSGVFKNEIPEPNSGWGFCSTDKSQEGCNGSIREVNDEALAHEMVILHNKHCENLLKENLKIDQPDVFVSGGENALNNIMERSKTLCIGQIHKHSFENEEFYVKKDGRGLKTVSYETAPTQNINRLKEDLYKEPKSKINKEYIEGGPGCFGDSGGPLWRTVKDPVSGALVPVLVGTFSYLLWGTCHGTQDLKYYDDIKYILPWIYNNVPKSETCEFGRELQDKRPKIAKDCQWSSWNSWHALGNEDETRCVCSKNNRNEKIGEQIRTRKVLVEGAGGKPCLKSDGQETRNCEACVIDNSTVDCKWGEWTFWSRCTCRHTEKTKRRNKVRQMQNGGSECSGDSTAKEKCHSDHCPECKWDGWTEWSQCSKSCGYGGTQVRRRSQSLEAGNRGRDCSGEYREERNCTDQFCCKENVEECCKDETWCAHIKETCSDPDVQGFCPQKCKDMLPKDNPCISKHM